MEDKYYSSVQETEDQLTSCFFKELSSKDGVVELLKNKKYLKIKKENVGVAKTQTENENLFYKKSIEEARKSSDLNFSQYKKRFKNKLKKFPTTSADKDLKDHYLKSLENQSFYSTVHSLKSIPSFILSLKEFRNFVSCQIFSHEKGSTVVDSFFSHGDSTIEAKTITTTQFNKIFKTLKKSKSKFFNKEDFAEQSIDTYGTFLAKVFNYQKHSLVLIISSNSFLPPTEEELKSFTQVTNQLQLLFHSVFNRNQIDLNVDQAISLLDNLGIPCRITRDDETLLFANSAYLQVSEIETRSPSLEKEIVDNHKLSFYFDNQIDQADAYHFYRINLLGELLNTLRHELSNPLFGLKLICDVLTTEVQDPEVIQTLQETGASADRCQNILKNFTRLYLDEQDFTEVNLQEVIEETLILTKSESRTIRKTLDFESSLKASAKTNPTWLSQIIFNLVINSAQALKLSQVNDPEIQVIVRQSPEGVKIQVKDNGPGIQKDEASKIFNPFYTTKDKGTGLGLTICQNLANKLGSKLTLEESSPKGTIFSMILPNEHTDS